MNNQTKKSKFKLNFFDITLLCVIMLVTLAVLYLSFVSDDGVSNGEQVKIEYRVQSIGLDTDLYESAKEADKLPKKGNKVYDHSTGSEIGEITQVIVSEPQGDGSTGVMLELILSTSGTLKTERDGVVTMNTGDISVRVGSERKLRTVNIMIDARFTEISVTE